MKKSVLSLLMVLSLGCFASFARAELIVVTNSSFLANGTSGASALTASGWTNINGGGTAGVDGAVYYNPSEPTAADDKLYMSGTNTAGSFWGASQNLAAANTSLTMSNYHTWTISFEAGFRNDVGQTGTANMQVQLLEGSTVLGTHNFSRSHTSGTSTETVTFTGVSAMTNNITLRFLNTSTAGTFGLTGVVDNVSINAVPEPTSLIMVGSAGLLMLRRRRKA